jgi:hypothetical protein
MMLVRDQGKAVGFLGATRYTICHGLLDEDGCRRVSAVCEIALEIRALTGHEIGRLPADRRSE